MPSPHLAAVTTRIRSDIDTLIRAAERAEALREACADLHQWAEQNSLGNVPQLAALVGRLRAVLGEMEG